MFPVALINSWTVDSPLRQGLKRTTERRLWVAEDAHGSRCKTWREVAAESSACQYDDYTICSADDSDVRAVVLSDIDFPIMWSDKFCVAKRIQDGDRVHSELEEWCRVL